MCDKSFRIAHGGILQIAVTGDAAGIEGKLFASKALCFPVNFVGISGELHPDVVERPAHHAGEHLDLAVDGTRRRAREPVSVRREAGHDGGETVEESLHTHLLRSLCPVTNQPDLGSLIVRYAGPRIDPASLLKYVVSFRQHQDFHEACVERIFVDILERCKPTRLSVYARYQRRGGIDINPFRTNCDEAPFSLRLWRQ